MNLYNINNIVDKLYFYSMNFVSLSKEFDVKKNLYSYFTYLLFLFSKKINNNKV